jgi:membrane-associated phospholipid phosphatase
MSSLADPVLALATIGQNSTYGPDEILFRALNLAGTSPLADDAMLAITALGVAEVLGLLVLPLWFTGRREAAVDFVVVMTITVLLTFVLKYATDRPRPCEVLSDINLLEEQTRCVGRDPAFPSGHASRTFALAGFALLRFRWPAGMPAFAFATLVGYSRIYLGVHWPTDILGGALLGIAAAWLVGRLDRRVGGYQSIRARIIAAIRAIPRLFRRSPVPPR